MTTLDINRPEFLGEVKDVCARAPSGSGAGHVRALGNVVSTTTTLRGGFDTAVIAFLREGSARVAKRARLGCASLKAGVMAST